MKRALVLLLVLAIYTAAQPRRNPTDPNPPQRGVVGTVFTPYTYAPAELQTFTGAPCQYDVAGFSSTNLTPVSPYLGSVYYDGSNIGCIVQGACAEPYAGEVNSLKKSFFQAWGCSVYNFVEATGKGYLLYFTNTNYNSGYPYPIGVGTSAQAMIYTAGTDGTFFPYLKGPLNVNEEDCNGIENWTGPFYYVC